MKGFALIVFAVALVACVARHISREIPPPGGCDQCHRLKIAGNWELAIAPTPLGREGGIPEERDLVIREVGQLPYHREVPAKRLAVYAATATPEVLGDAETGIQCFICHRSPGPPHESFRGKIPHPWGATQGDR